MFNPNTKPKPTLFISSYSAKSKGAHELAEALDAVVLSSSSGFRAFPENSVIINWGRNLSLQDARDWFGIDNLRFLMFAPKVRVGKLQQFSAFSAYNRSDAASITGPVPFPEATVSLDAAKVWLDKGHKLYVRETNDGNNGAGIVVISTKEEYQEYLNTSSGFSFITKGFDTTAEYRIYVYNGKVFDRFKVLPKDGVDISNTDVRSEPNGYCHSRVELAPVPVIRAAERAMKALQLTFGGVDIGYNKLTEQACVFEVNRAPGIYQSTAAKLASCILKEVSA